MQCMMHNLDDEQHAAMRLILYCLVYLKFSTAAVAHVVVRLTSFQKLAGDFSHFSQPLFLARAIGICFLQPYLTFIHDADGEVELSSGHPTAQF